MTPRRHRRHRHLAIVAAIAIVMVACGGTATPGPTGTAPTATPGGPGETGTPATGPAATPTVSGGPPATATPAGTLQPMTPLPVEVLLFERAVSASPRLVHLYALDLRTGESRLFTDFPAEGQTGATVWGVDISPDRRWVVFAALFRPSLDDFVNATGSEIVWLVGSDGETFVRLSPPTPDLGATWTTCSQDPDCPDAQFCGSEGYCRLTFQTYEVTDPSWSPDGSGVVYAIGQYRSVGGSTVGGATLAALPISGGIPELFGVGDVDCGQVTDPALPPAGGALVAHASLCAEPAVDGIYAWDLATRQARLLVESSISTLYLPLATPAWLPDGSGFLFLAKDNFTDGRGGTFQGIGVFVYDVASGQNGAIIPPLAPGIDAESVAVSPDGTAVAVCFTSPANGAADIYVGSLAETPIRLAPLTSDGASCHPAW